MDNKKEKLIKRVESLTKSNTYKNWILNIINLKSLMPEKYDIGIVVNFTLYRMLKGEKIPIAYFFVDGSGITIIDQDHSGNEMSELCYDITNDLKETLKIVNGKKVFFYNVITDEDAKDVYNKILKL